MKWKRYLRVELLFNLSLVALSLFFLFASLGFSYRNRVFPLIFSVISLLLALIFLWQYIKKANSWTDETAAAYRVNWRPFFLVLILFLYTGGIYLLGLTIASCLFSALFIWLWGRQKLWIGLVCAGITFFFIYVVFGMFMQMQMYKGVLGLL